MITTSEVSLKAEMRIDTEGGMTIFKAWGRMMRRIVWLVARRGVAGAEGWRALRVALSAHAGSAVRTSAAGVG